jgi:hypothetical protein
MAEIVKYTFSHKEVVEALLKQQGIHEGLWALYIEFGLAGVNLADPSGSGGVVPVAIIPIQKIGLQKGTAEDTITVDAAKVNPATSNAT